LGRESFLTAQFFKITDGEELELPIFVEDREEKSTSEQRLMRKLMEIEHLLNQPRDQVIIKEVEKAAQPTPSPVILTNQDLVCECCRKIRDWNVGIQILKDKTQKLGNLVINCRKDKDCVSLIISEERIFKLLTLMNTTDILPDECSLNSLTPQEFLELAIFPFLEIDDNKNIEIFPRAHSFISPFVTTAFGKETIVFLYHIRNNEFRLAFGQKGQSETYYLEVELQQEFIKQTLEIAHEVEPRIYKIYESLMTA
jgi:hypothetical protein